MQNSKTSSTYSSFLILYIDLSSKFESNSGSCLDQGAPLAPEPNCRVGAKLSVASKAWHVHDCRRCKNIKHVHLEFMLTPFHVCIPCLEYYVKNDTCMMLNDSIYIHKMILKWYCRYMIYYIYYTYIITTVTTVSCSMFFIATYVPGGKSVPVEALATSTLRLSLRGLRWHFSAPPTLRDSCRRLLRTCNIKYM